MSRHFAGYSSVALETIWLHEPRDLIFLGPLMTLLCLSRYSRLPDAGFHEACLTNFLATDHVKCHMASQRTGHRLKPCKHWTARRLCESSRPAFSLHGQFIPVEVCPVSDEEVGPTNECHDYDE